MAINEDRLVNFSESPKYERLFSRYTALTAFATNNNGTIAKYWYTLNRRKLSAGRLCDEGSVVAINPSHAQNIANETYWFALVTSIGPEPGEFVGQWFASAVYTRCSVDDEMVSDLVENKAELAQEISDFDLPRTALYLTNTRDVMQYSMIQCVLTVDEFKTLKFDPRLEIQWDGTVCHLI